MFNTIVGAEAVGAGAASRYGSGSDQKMRLLAAPAPQHWFRNYLLRIRTMHADTNFFQMTKLWPQIYYNTGAFSSATLPPPIVLPLGKDLFWFRNSTSNNNLTGGEEENGERSILSKKHIGTFGAFYNKNRYVLCFL
jgi:hypothetical protein